MNGRDSAVMVEVWEDPRVAAGITRQLEALARLEAGGAALVGWKVGLGDDVPPDAEAARAARAIAGIGPAIELADVDLPLDQLEEVVAGNIFHRAVVLGPCDTDRAGGGTDGIGVDVVRNGTLAPAPTSRRR